MKDSPLMNYAKILKIPLITIWKAVRKEVWKWKSLTVAG